MADESSAYNLFGKALQKLCAIIEVYFTHGLFFTQEVSPLTTGFLKLYLCLACFTFI